MLNRRLKVVGALFALSLGVGSLVWSPTKFSKIIRIKAEPQLKIEDLTVGSGELSRPGQIVYIHWKTF